MFEKKITAVFKIGTDALCKPDGMPNEDVLDHLGRQISVLMNEAHHIVVVSSGAVGVGRRELDKRKSKYETATDKALYASVGMPILIGNWYSPAFKKYGLRAAGQALMESLHFSMNDNVPRYNLRELLLRGFAEHGFVTVLNENDPLSRVELKKLDENDPNKIKDNDALSREVGKLIDADLLVTISTHCVHDKNPLEHADAQPISSINLADSHTQDISTDGRSNGGTGGMEGKLTSLADFVRDGGCDRRKAYVITTNDLMNNNGLLVAARGGPVGTEIVCKKPSGSLCHVRCNHGD